MFAVTISAYASSPYFGTTDKYYTWQGDLDDFRWASTRSISLYNQSGNNLDKQLYTYDIDLTEVKSWQCKMQLLSQFSLQSNRYIRIFLLGKKEESTNITKGIYLEFNETIQLIQNLDGEKTTLGSYEYNLSETSFTWIVTRKITADNKYRFTVKIDILDEQSNEILESFSFTTDQDVEPEPLEDFDVFSFYICYCSQKNAVYLMDFSVETGIEYVTDDDENSKDTETPDDSDETPQSSDYLIFGNENSLYYWYGQTDNFTVYDNGNDKNTMLQLTGDSNNGGTATIYTQDVEISSIKSWYSELYYTGIKPSTSNYMMVMLATDDTYENYLALKYQKNASLVLSKNGKETTLMTDDRFDVTNTDYNDFAFQISRTVTADNIYQLDIILNFDEDNNDYTSTVTLDPKDIQSLDRMAIKCVYTKTRATKMYAAYFTVETGFEDVDLPEDETVEDDSTENDTSQSDTDDKDSTPQTGTATEETEAVYSTGFSRGCIVINEVMPRELDLDYLPTAEYIELYNATDSTYNLEDWTLKINTTTKTLPDVNIAPHDYLVITPTAYAEAFEEIADNVLGISWTNINNTSCAIILSNPDGLVSDVFDYNNTLFGTDFHKDGGFSLEKIDPTNLSLENYLWEISDSDFGGTPGSENYNSRSYPDIYSPRILNMHVDSTGTILTVDYSEPIDTSRLCNTLKINGVTTTVNPLCDDNIRLKRINYYLPLKLSHGEIYNVSSIVEYDLAGNQLEESTSKVAIMEVAEEGDVLINEIMFTGSPYANDFVEIYNYSNKPIDLRSLYFCVIEDNGITKHEKISESTRIMLPGEYFVICKDSTVLLDNYDYVEEHYAVTTSGFGTASTGNLDNSSATLAISNGNGKLIIDKAYYSKDMHSASLVSTDNVSLERVHFAVSAMESTNWQSASESAGYATPTKENSQARNDNQTTSSDEVTIVNSIVTPTNNLAVQTNFTDEGSWTCTMRIYNAIGQVVATPYNNILLSPQTELTWNGTTDEGSNLAPGNYAIYISVWNDRGKTKNFKKSCTIAVDPK